MAESGRLFRKPIFPKISHPPFDKGLCVKGLVMRSGISADSGPGHVCAQSLFSRYFVGMPRPGWSGRISSEHARRWAFRISPMR